MHNTNVMDYQAVICSDAYAEQAFSSAVDELKHNPVVIAGRVEFVSQKAKSFLTQLRVSYLGIAQVIRDFETGTLSLDEFLEASSILDHFEDVGEGLLERFSTIYNEFKQVSGPNCPTFHAMLMKNIRQAISDLVHQIKTERTNLVLGMHEKLSPEAIAENMSEAPRLKTKEDIADFLISLGS